MHEVTGLSTFDRRGYVILVPARQVTEVRSGCRCDRKPAIQQALVVSVDVMDAGARLRARALVRLPGPVIALVGAPFVPDLDLRL